MTTARKTQRQLSRQLVLLGSSGRMVSLSAAEFGLRHEAEGRTVRSAQSDHSRRPGCSKPRRRDLRCGAKPMQKMTA